MRVQIERVHDAEVLRELHAVDVAQSAFDHVGMPADPFEELLPNLTPEPDDPQPQTFFVARHEGSVVGRLGVGLPRLENLDLANVDLAVHPSHRSRGFGRALLEQAMAFVREQGRHAALFEVCSPWDEGAEGLGEPLLRSVGAVPKLFEARRVLDVADLGPGAVPEEPPAGYRLEQWVDVAPDELVDGLAGLSARMSTDAPMGELTLEPEAWDAARYRTMERSALARNRMRVCTAVVHETSGEVAGATDFGVNREQHEVAYQWDTIVDPAHRGHGLGLVIKAHNLQQLRETVPDVRWVSTWNALSNTHMVAVNDILGFRPVERWTEWQLDL